MLADDGPPEPWWLKWESASEILVDLNHLTQLLAKEYFIPFAQKHYITTVTGKLASTRICSECSRNLEWVQKELIMVEENTTDADGGKPILLPSTASMRLLSLAWLIWRYYRNIPGNSPCIFLKGRLQCFTLHSCIHCKSTWIKNVSLLTSQNSSLNWPEGTILHWEF
jgi:hypothetical protein